MSNERLMEMLGESCVCGCGQPRRPASQYATDACRARSYDQRNPRVSKAPPELLHQRLAETAPVVVPPPDWKGYDPENPVVMTKAITREEAESRWPSRPPPEAEVMPPGLEKLLDVEAAQREACHGITPAMRGTETGEAAGSAPIGDQKEGASLTIRYPPEAFEELVKQQQRRASRRPRPPRIHIDVLAEDAELLDSLAGRLGITRTGYVRELLRWAAESGLFCPRCSDTQLVEIGTIQAGDQIESEYGACPLCAEETS